MDFSGTTILCLGDIMLDRFAYCGIERISPEAPVLLLDRVESMLGGAGNVARNIAALGELMLELARDDRVSPHGKLYDQGEAETLLRQWKGRGLSVGFTNGCFDILHPGHVALLASARAQCDRLIVALNSDASTTRLKGPGRPVNALPDRAAVIAALESVDAVTSFDDDTPLDLIVRLGPDVLIKGADYTFETTVGAAEVTAAGGRVALIGLIEGHSMTRTIGRLQQDEVEDGSRRQGPRRYGAGYHR